LSGWLLTKLIGIQLRRGKRICLVHRNSHHTTLHFHFLTLLSASSDASLKSIGCWNSNMIITALLSRSRISACFFNKAHNWFHSELLNCWKIASYYFQSQSRVISILFESVELCVYIHSNSKSLFLLGKREGIFCRRSLFVLLL